MNKERRKKIRAEAKKKQDKKREIMLKREIKKIEESEINRSLLLKPEDRIDKNDGK